jgi:hypothetical protein
MGLSANQARLNVLTSRKADLELRLTSLANQAQLLASKQAQAVADKATALTSYINNSADQTVSFENTQAYMEYETSMAELESADLRLTQQQKSVETQHQAVEAEEEQIQKLVETNVKKSFGYFN